MRYNKRYRKPDRENREFKGLQVEVFYTGNDTTQRDTDLDKALSRFKKLLLKEGLMQEMKDRKYFRSPGQKKYEKRRRLQYKLSRKKDKSDKRFKKPSRDGRG